MEQAVDFCGSLRALQFRRGASGNIVLIMKKITLTIIGCAALTMLAQEVLQPVAPPQPTVYRVTLTPVVAAEPSPKFQEQEAVRCFQQYPVKFRSVRDRLCQDLFEGNGAFLSKDADERTFPKARRRAKQGFVQSLLLLETGFNGDLKGFLDMGLSYDVTETGWLNVTQVSRIIVIHGFSVSKVAHDARRCHLKLHKLSGDFSEAPTSKT